VQGGTHAALPRSYPSAMDWPKQRDAALVYRCGKWHAHYSELRFSGKTSGESMLALLALPASPLPAIGGTAVIETGATLVILCKSTAPI